MNRYVRCVEIDKPFDHLSENEQCLITEKLIQSYKDSLISYPKLSFGQIVFSEDKNIFSVLSPKKKYVRGYYCEAVIK